MKSISLYPADIYQVVDKSLISEMDKLPNDDEITKIGYEEMYKILSSKVEAPDYSDETVSVTINLHKNDKGMYEISEEDMLTLDNALFAIE